MRRHHAAGALVGALAVALPFAACSGTTLIGANIPMTGTVDLILNPAGSAGTTCALGAASEDCSNVLTMKRSLRRGEA